MLPVSQYAHADKSAEYQSEIACLCYLSFSADNHEPHIICRKNPLSSAPGRGRSPAGQPGSAKAPSAGRIPEAASSRTASNAVQQVTILSTNEGGIAALRLVSLWPVMLTPDTKHEEEQKKHMSILNHTLQPGVTSTGIPWINLS